jgi:Flp pilus assembly protein TadD
MQRRILPVILALVLLIALTACEGAPAPAGDPAALIQEGKTLLSQGQTDAAIAKLQEAVKVNPNAAEARFVLGNAYAQKEQFVQAEEHLLKAVQLDDKNVDARSNLGFVYYRQGKLQDAEKTFRVALGMQPNDAEVHYNLGGTLAALNRLDEAVNEFLKAKEINPALPEPYLGLGSVYKLQGRRAEAVAAFREYLKLAQDPNWRGQAEQSLRELGEKP